MVCFLIWTQSLLTFALVADLRVSAVAAWRAKVKCLWVSYATKLDRNMGWIRLDVLEKVKKERFFHTNLSDSLLGFYLYSNIWQRPQNNSISGPNYSNKVGQDFLTNQS